MPSSANTFGTEACPLCLSQHTTPFAKLALKAYAFCPRCHYTFLHRAHWLSFEDEKAQYDLHNNQVHDIHYRSFLNRLAAPLMALLPPTATGLDMGCGPGPALAHMLTEQGFTTAYYDPFYFPNTELLMGQYDFVTSTEVVEHLRTPYHTWQQFKRLVKPGGYLAIMTSWRVPAAQFATWHYPKDPTHIGFYQPQTFRWLAKQWAWAVSFPATNVCFLKRPMSAG